MFHGLFLTVLMSTPNNLPVIDTGHDKIPDFAANPTVVSVSSGNWVDPGVWSTGKVPGRNDIARIEAGHTVYMMSASGHEADCLVLGIAGKLRHGSGSLRVGTLLVYETGTYEVSHFGGRLIIRDIPVTDPDQFGTGLIVLGEFFTADADEPAVPYIYGVLSEDGMQLEGSRSLARGPARIAFADSREPWQFEFNGWMSVGNQVEEMPCTVVSQGIVSLSGKLRYNHVKYVPHAIWGGRQFTIRSANPNGMRGHVLATGNAAVNISGVNFINLGRTTGAALEPTRNHIGRYTLHLHRLHGGGHTVHRCAIVHNKRWGLAIHDCHDVAVTENLVYDTQGAGIALEQGTEYDCVIERNFILLVHGAPDLMIARRGEEESQRSGTGIWINTAAVGGDLTKNIIRQNIAANVRGPGYNLFTPGYEDTSVNGKPSGIWQSRSPIFEGNEAHACVVAVEGWRITDPLVIEGFISRNCQIGLSAPFDAFSGMIARNSTFIGTRRYPQHNANTLPNFSYASCGMLINGSYLGKLDAEGVKIEGFDYGIYNIDRWPKWGVRLTNCMIDDVHTGIYAPSFLWRQDDLQILLETGWFFENLQVDRVHNIAIFPWPYSAQFPLLTPATITRDFVAIP